MPPGSAMASSRAATLTPSRENISVLDYDVPHIDPHPELNAPVGRNIGIPLSHAGLHLHSTTKRIHYTTELYEEAVTRRLCKPAVMRGDGWLKLLDPYSLEGLESTVLVHPDQARVARHIGGKDRGKTAGLAHASSPVASRRPDRKSSRYSVFRR